MHSSTLTKIKARRQEKSSSGRQARQNDSKVRIPRTAARQAKPRQGREGQNLSSAVFFSIRKETTDQVRICPFAQLSKDDQSSSPKRQPDTTQDRRLQHDRARPRRRKPCWQIPDMEKSMFWETSSATRQPDLKRQPTTRRSLMSKRRIRVVT